MHPLTLPETWFSLDSEQFTKLRSDVAQWIKGESSLTVKIKELGIAFNVAVLAQTTLPNRALLHPALPSQEGSALFREVLLQQGDVPLVYAQTIMPDTTTTGTETMLTELGNQSLGQVLFQSPQAIRGDIEFAEVTPTSQLGLYIQQELQQTINEPCYIRRSLFHLNRKPLLVCECFLPSLFQ
ncbi:chorismate lyase [Psychrosphaera sp. B3R10]|uniref:Chorismate lyase n=1 Tax=Psychrosphaera algicola TaxID=3023714 RepID=A0ABT5FE25_9GAMM|nr:MULTISPECIES: chorismate lyase [unclassified Psychrosphaera]MBU2883354.1 chorismate lyase [Psychrosphaera sp. I2R16]MBU2990552.1 chorismate lyase [Psychrosphaera sp. B3R10]MDC2889801.1 chorismate lyase [Psychrosphaera sp. G1-22]